MHIISGGYIRWIGGLTTPVKNNKYDLFLLNLCIFMSQEGIGSKTYHQFNNFPGGKGKYCYIEYTYQL